MSLSFLRTFFIRSCRQGLSLVWFILHAKYVVRSTTEFRLFLVLYKQEVKTHFQIVKRKDGQSPSRKDYLRPLIVTWNLAFKAPRVIFSRISGRVTFTTFKLQAQKRGREKRWYELSCLECRLGFRGL